MSSLNNTISAIYNNLHTFFEYRNLTPLDDKLDNDEFIKHIYNNEYFLMHTVCGDIKDEIVKSEIKNNLTNMKYKNKEAIPYKITYVILFHYATDIHSKSPEFKKIMSMLSKTPFLYNVIVITKNTLSTHVKNYISTINNKRFENISSDAECPCQYAYCNCLKLQIFTYEYERFTFIIPNHILSSKHKIIGYEDEQKLLEQLLINKSKFPVIKVNDPQIIWSPGIAGNIVEITRNDEITGMSIYYRVIRD